MFATKSGDNLANLATPKPAANANAVPFIPGQQYNVSTITDAVNYNTIDNMLEKEKQQNKTETWNKLDKTVKIQKLHAFAEKYGKEHGLPVKEIKNLKVFFVECLEKMKLQKTKDVVYNKDSHDITSIPALHFNSEKKNFTLRILDAKRVSTLKSLTPKRVTEKNKTDADDEQGNQGSKGNQGSPCDPLL
jgi:hypothetical protein